MIKGGLFCLGISGGLLIGIHFREKGMTSGLSHAYKAFKNEPSDSDKTKKVPKNTMNDMLDMLEAGALSDDTFQAFKENVYSKRMDNIDQASLDEFENILQVTEIRKESEINIKVNI